MAHSNIVGKGHFLLPCRALGELTILSLLWQNVLLKQFPDSIWTHRHTVTRLQHGS